MKHYVIHRENLLFMALNIKRSALGESAPTTLTINELNNYINLVYRTIEKERQIAQSFTFELKNEGEAIHPLYNKDNKITQSINSVHYTYDPNTGLIQTSSPLAGLKLRSLEVFPHMLKSCMLAKGYQDALNLYPKLEPGEE